MFSNKVISHGIDLVDINRVEFNSPKLFKKILHESEISFYENKNDFNKKKIITTYWAIKEAIIKAVPVKLTMNEIYLEQKNGIYYCLNLKYKFIITTSTENKLLIASVICLQKKRKLWN